MQAGVGLGDPGQLVRLLVGEVVGVLPECIAGVLEPARVAGGQARAVSVTGSLPRSSGLVPGIASYFVEGFGGPLDTWKGSAHCTAFGQRSATISAIHSAWSADTCVIVALRSGPSWSKNVRNVAWSRPGAAHSSRPVSWSTTTVK